MTGIALLALILTTPGVLEREALQAAGDLASTLTERDLPAAALSAVLAGAVITTFTWLSEASESDLTRVVLALLIGFVLLAPSTNHSVRAWRRRGRSSRPPAWPRPPTASDTAP